MVIEEERKSKPGPFANRRDPAPPRVSIVLGEVRCRAEGLPTRLYEILVWDTVTLYCSILPPETEFDTQLKFG